MLIWKPLIGCKAISELSSLQVGCPTLKTSLKSTEMSTERRHSELFNVVLKDEQPICKLASSEKALQPTNDSHINIPG